ncbi:MAG TPA: GNAT family N-acetyltransferase [Streptosporangiaceae bacterium]|jgi:RimJ/RimL family protein N-acetyltransferase
MAWTLTENLEQYDAAVGGVLRASPVSHTIQLSVLETLRVNGASAFGETAPLFGWCQSADGGIDGSFLVTPPFPILLTPMSLAAVRQLAEAFRASGRDLVGVNSDQGTATAFAAAWHELTGAKSAVHRRTRMFRLDSLVRPEPWPAGAARVAAEPDRQLLERWFGEFGREVNELGHFSGVIDDRLSYGGITLWEAGGVPVAMAGMTRAVAGVARVGPVYTPADQRRQGYAGAATVTISQSMLDAGIEHVILFTDLANPTSNALYQRIGYIPVEDTVILEFT